MARPRTSNAIDAVKALPGRLKRTRRTADAFKSDGRISEGLSGAPGISDEDPAIALRRAELAAADRRERTTPGVLTMEDLIQFARKFPYGTGQTAGSDRRSHISYADDDFAEMDTDSVWTPVT